MLDGAAAVFQTGQKASKDKQAEALTDQLYRQIGQLTVSAIFCHANWENELQPKRGNALLISLSGLSLEF